MIDSTDQKVPHTCPPEGVVGWRSPSNIALIKYWGKQPQREQLPANPSLSFTLSHAFTDMWLYWSKRTQADDPIELKLYFEGRPADNFRKRIYDFMLRLLPEMPFLGEYAITIHTRNSFPHSAGIASSASAMSALALCLVEWKYRCRRAVFDLHQHYREVSNLARRASGSACRSVVPQVALWGAHPNVSEASDSYAIPLAKAYRDFAELWKDLILIVDQSPKSISSSQGHALMESHPYAATRYQQATEHLSVLLKAMKEGDVETFGRVVEAEALTLHALMMCSPTPYLLIKPQTLEVIDAIQNWRRTRDLPMYFTLDAGPNVHLLYPQAYEAEIWEFLATALPTFYRNPSRYLADEVGHGPQPLEAQDA